MCVCVLVYSCACVFVRVCVCVHAFLHAPLTTVVALLLFCTIMYSLHAVSEEPQKNNILSKASSKQLLLELLSTDLSYYFIILCHC